jgi:hypothetical protein
MKWLRTGTRELVGLFVDDGAFAAFIITWISFICVALPKMDLPMVYKGMLLAAGLLVILLGSTTRRSRNRQ